jgi:hypothetical protein
VAGLTIETALEQARKRGGGIDYLDTKAQLQKRVGIEDGPMRAEDVYRTCLLCAECQKSVKK